MTVHSRVNLSAESPPICRVGAPLWAHAPWVGRFFTRAATRSDFLPQYASVFGTTEGNATFYGLPSEDTVRRWAAEAPDAFRFCFKFPREISHDRQLRDATEATTRFFQRLEPLGTRLGPFFLQLPVGFGPDRLPALTAYLATLPAAFTYAVEVRHPDFFNEGPGERALEARLAERGVDRVIFDTRGLFASTATDEHTRDAQRKKPRVPVRLRVTGPRPFVRFVGDPEVNRNSGALATWAAQVVAWMREGRSPYFFLHHPDDAHAPALARVFQAALHACDPSRLPPPPVWPCEAERPPAAQLDLFAG